MTTIRDGQIGQTTILDPSPSGLLIPDDGGTVVHVSFNGSTILDRFGNSWTQNGTVPQVARSDRTPPGAGPFSDTNYYSNAAPSALAIVGNFSACVIVGNSAASNNKVLVSANNAGFTAGWELQTNGVLGYTASIVGTAISDNSGLSSGIDVVCFGRASTTGLLKVNLRAIASGVVATTADTTDSGKIGRATAATVPWPGLLYEVWASTTTPTDALFTAIMQRVKAKLRITAW